MNWTTNTLGEMRKFTILMASILAMVGCAKNSDFDNVSSRNRVEMTVSAGQETTEVSRVAFNGGITDMVWEDNDQIKIHIASTGETATFEAFSLSDDRKRADFRAEIYEPETIDSYYAYYPTTTGINGTNVNFIVPIETSTSATTPYMVASCEEVMMDQVNLEFKPVTALLELTLGFAAEKVVIEGNNNEYLAGILSYNCADGSLTQPAGSKSITLTAPVAGTYYLHIPEVTLSKGYKVTVVKDGAQMIKSVGYGKEKKFVAGEITPLTISSFEGISVNLCDVYTTYTLAQRKNSEANNTANTNIIFFNGNCSYTGISSTMVTECGVSCGGTNITANASNKQFSIANQTNKGQGAYEVYAYIKTVDGKTYTSAKQTVYITGLPYSISFGNTSSPSGWSVSNTGTKDNGQASKLFGMKSGEAYAISPRFTLPANTNVSASFSMSAYTTIGGKLKPNVYISASESDVKSNLVKQLSSTANYAVSASFTNVATTVVLSSSVGKVCMHTSGTANNIYGPFTYVKSCTINYAW